MSQLIETFYSDLRKLKEGKFAILLGAGASYDYGIPTMSEMAKMLMDELAKPSFKIFDAETTNVLKAIIGESGKKNGKGKKTNDDLQWNIEDLLTQLHRIQDAMGDKNSPFTQVIPKIGASDFTKEKITATENKLIEFMVICYQLDICEKTAHGDRSIKYLSDFIELIGEFHNSLSIFTTNNDLCVETAIMRLSQMSKNTQKKEFYLIDGFSHGSLPIFSMSNFSLMPQVLNDRIITYLWKLHGSIDWTYTNPIDGTLDGSDKFTDESIICRYIDEIVWKQLQVAGAISKKVSIDKSKIMIFPTPSKYSQTYNNPYMDLYQAFRRTLETVEILLVVGTSFPDGHINSAIKAFLSRTNTMLYIVDPNVKKADVSKTLGDRESIQPIMDMNFKEFIEKLKKIETPQNEEDLKESGKNDE